MSLKGERVFIVGGGSAVGFAVAQAVLERGAHVVVGVEVPEAEARVQEALPGSVQTCVIDLRDVRGVEHCFDQVGRFRHLVVVVERPAPAPFIEADLEEMRRVCDANFWGQLAAVQLALPNLEPGGSVTLLSGVEAHVAVKDGVFAGAVAAAVESVVRSLACALSPLRVNAVAPGFVDAGGADAERRERLAERLPAGRVGTPEDVAHAILFALTNDFVTGSVVHVDGGGRALH